MKRIVPPSADDLRTQHMVGFKCTTPFCTCSNVYQHPACNKLPLFRFRRSVVFLTCFWLLYSLGQMVLLNSRLEGSGPEGKRACPPLAPQWSPFPQYPLAGFVFLGKWMNKWKDQFVKKHFFNALVHLAAFWILSSVLFTQWSLFSNILALYLTGLYTLQWTYD